jgi:hypothetical protein
MGHLEGLDRLTHQVAGEPELGGQLRLGREFRSGGQLTGLDQLADAGDGLVGKRHGDSSMDLALRPAFIGRAILRRPPDRQARPAHTGPAG